MNHVTSQEQGTLSGTKKLRPCFPVFSYSTYGISVSELLESVTTLALNGVTVNCPVSGYASSTSTKSFVWHCAL